MSEALVKEFELAASLSASNQSSGAWWARCPQGKIMRIRGVGIVAYGTAAVASAVPATSGFKFEIKADQRPIANLNAPTMYLEESAATTLSVAEYHVIDSVIPINDVLTPGEELNFYATTPANGECMVLLLMQLVDLAEVR